MKLSKTELKELFAERASIIEYDAGLPRELAEQQALGELIRRYGTWVRPLILGSTIPPSLAAISGILTGTAFAQFRESVASSAK